MKEYKEGVVINKTESFILTGPRHAWDMNYHLFDIDTGLEHLIDIGDVVDTEKEQEEYGGILFEQLTSFEHVDDVMDIVWKTI